MPKATLFKDNQRVAVDVGSQQAKDYFAKGFKLETKAPVGDLGGTMSEELPSASGNTAEFANFRNLLTDMTRAAYDKKPSIKDALAQFNTQIGAGAGVVAPTIAGAVLDTERQRRTGNVGDIFAKTMNTINSMEKIRAQQIENANSLMGDLAIAGLLDQLTGKEFEQIRTTGVLPMETLQKINLKVNEMKNKPEQVSPSEKLAGLKEGYEWRDEDWQKATGTNDPITGVPTDSTKVIKAGDKAYDFTSYATDKNWGNAVNNILASLPTFSSDQEVNNYIQQIAPGSKLRAEDISSVANETVLSPELLLSISQHESQFMTAGVGARTNNPANYGNVDSGGTRSFTTPKDGLMALANNIKRREIDLTKQKGIGLLSPEAQQYYDNPSLLAGLTPTKRGEINAEFADKGYDIPQQLSYEDKAQMEQSLAKDFNTVAKEAKSAIRQIDTMNMAYGEALKDPGKMNAASQGILVVYQKMLDPTSVVRESEYARSGTGLSLAGRIQGYIDKLQKGGAGVKVEDLKDFVDVANSYYENIYKPAIIDEANLKIRTADKYNLDKELILTDTILNLVNLSEYPAGAIIEQDGKKYVSLGNGQFEEVK